MVKKLINNEGEAQHLWCFILVAKDKNNQEPTAKSKQKRSPRGPRSSNQKHNQEQQDIDPCPLGCFSPCSAADFVAFAGWWFSQFVLSRHYLLQTRDPRPILVQLVGCLGLCLVVGCLVVWSAGGSGRNELGPGNYNHPSTHTYMICIIN